jgi:hypothetical protein
VSGEGPGRPGMPAAVFLGPDGKVVCMHAGGLYETTLLRPIARCLGAGL